MKTRERIKRAVTWFILACYILQSAMGISAAPSASENDITQLFPLSNQVEVTELEGEIERGQETHKGFLPMHLILWKETEVEEKEIYLPVVVNEKDKVYVPAEIAAGHLELEYQPFSGSGFQLTMPGGSLVFRNQRSQMIYYPEDVEGNMFEDEFVLDGSLPVQWYEERWCVGLDDFLNATGCIAFYADDDKDSPLVVYAYVVPSKLDTFRTFFAGLDARYWFLMTDIGNFAQNGKLLRDAVITYLAKFWSFDYLNFTLSGWFPTKEADAYAEFYYDKPIMEKYLAYQLTCNQEMNEGLLERMKNSVEPLGDILSTAGKTGLFSSKSVEEIMKKLNFRSDLITGWAKKHGDGLDHFLKGGKFSFGIAALKHLLSFIGMKEQYENGNAYDIDAAAIFLNGWKEQGSNLTTPLVNVIREEMTYYQREGKKTFLDLAKRYVDQNIADLYKDGMAIAGIAFAPELTIPAVLWSSAVKILSLGAVSKAEAFMCGYYGIRYELDSICVAQEKYREFLKMEKPDEKDIQELEYLACNAAKACYCSRALTLEGCSGIGENADFRAFSREQKAINEEIAQYYAKLRDPYSWRGYTPQEMKENMTQRLLYLPHIIWNMAQLTGQILDINTGKPAKNVMLGIYGDEEEPLGMDTTGKDGYFTLTFDLDDGDIYAQRPDIRDLTLHMLTEKYAVCVLPVTVKSGHRYSVDGLRTGELEKENFIYLTGATEQNGAVILDAHLIVMDKDTCMLEPIETLGLKDPIYAPLGDQISVEETVTRLMLPYRFSFSTVYGHAFEGIEWAGLMIDELTGGTEGQTLIQSELEDAEQIDAYIRQYYETNHEYPAYRMVTTNSKIKKLEPLYIVSG